MSKFTIRYFAPGTLSAGNPAQSHHVVTFAVPTGETVALSLRPGDEGARGLDVNDKLVTLIVLDLLRPGWQDCYAPHAKPILVGSSVYQGFSMTRPSRVFDGTSWEVECLVSSHVLADFAWSDAVELVDDVYATILKPGEAHV